MKVVDLFLFNVFSHNICGSRHDIKKQNIENWIWKCGKCQQGWVSII